MLNLTTRTPILDPEEVQQLAPAMLADPMFLEGFRAGMEALETDMEDRGGMLKTTYLCRVIARELDPLVIAGNLEFDRVHGTTPLSGAFFAGFLAGWTALHTSRVHGWSHASLSPCVEA